MARALMAGIPLGIVLVAALVVPLAVIPGTFGFHSWPTHRAEQVTDRPVREPVRVIQVADSRPESPVAGRRSAIVARPGGGREGAVRVPAAADPAHPQRQSASVVGSPGRGGQGEGHGPGSPSAPAQPATPQTPASEGEPAPAVPATDTPAPQLANGETPVLRDDQPAAPATPASPVQPVAPAPSLPAEPCPPAPSQPAGDDGGEDGGSAAGDIVSGVGHDHGRHLGLGRHGRD